jgi:hypothetical protein
VDALRKDDLERARATSFERRAAQALSAMRSGIRLKRAALRARLPLASDVELDERVQRWLERDE